MTTATKGKPALTELESLRIKEWSRLNETAQRWAAWRRDPEGNQVPDNSLHWELIRCYRVAQHHGMKGVETRITRLEESLKRTEFWGR